MNTELFDTMTLTSLRGKSESEKIIPERNSFTYSTPKSKLYQKAVFLRAESMPTWCKEKKEREVIVEGKLLRSC